MNLAETARMVAYLARVRRGQPFDDETARAWAPMLTDVRIEDAQAVAVQLATTVDWIGPDDITKAVRILRRDRLERAGFSELTPNVEPLIEIEGRRVENPAHRAEKLALRDAIASGRMVGEAVEAYRRGELPTLTGAPKAIEAGQPTSTRNLARVLGRAVRGAS